MITTLQQFVDKANELQSRGRIGDMHDVFEEDTSEDVRDQVYDLSDPDTPEPFRSAMINLGFVNF